MVAIGRFALGRSELGDGPGNLQTTFGSVVAATDAGSGQSNAQDCPGGMLSGFVFRQLVDANTASPLYAPYQITGGQIVEDIREQPYATGTVELDGRTAFDIQSTVLIWNERQAFPEVTIYENVKLVDGSDRPVVGGRYVVNRAYSQSALRKNTITLEVFAEANGVLGATVSGDLTEQALPFASSLGLVAGGRASIEGIAAWILQQGGRTVRRGPGITPKTAYTAVVTDSFGVSRYLGPFNISPKMGAAQVLTMARWMGGIWTMQDGDGAAILMGQPTSTTASAFGTALRIYGYTPCEYPVRKVTPKFHTLPALVTVNNQSTVAAPNDENVAISGGSGPDLVYHFANFNPSTADQARRAQELAFVKTMEAFEVDIEPRFDLSVHAGDNVILLLNSHGVPAGIYMIVRAVHPLGTEPCATLTCQLMARLV